MLKSSVELLPDAQKSLNFAPRCWKVCESWSASATKWLKNAPSAHEVTKKAPRCSEKSSQALEKAAQVLQKQILEPLQRQPARPEILLKPVRLGLLPGIL